MHVMCGGLFQPSLGSCACRGVFVHRNGEVSVAGVCAVRPACHSCRGLPVWAPVVVRILTSLAGLAPCPGLLRDLRGSPSLSTPRRPPHIFPCQPLAYKARLVGGLARAPVNRWRADKRAALMPPPLGTSSPLTLPVRGPPRPSLGSAGSSLVPFPFPR